MSSYFQSNSATCRQFTRSGAVLLAIGIVFLVALHSLPLFAIFLALAVAASGAARKRA
jgi:hypothetical protein